MCLIGKVVELFISLDPDRYKQYVVTTMTGNKIIYMILVRALYCIRQAALLFYRELTDDLHTYGFDINSTASLKIER